MTQLIVRPIDDDRYSKRSQMDYIVSLRDYDYDLYKREYIKFSVRFYSQGISSILQTVCDMSRVFNKMLESAAINLGKQIRRGIDERKSAL